MMLEIVGEVMPNFSNTHTQSMELLLTVSYMLIPGSYQILNHSCIARVVLESALILIT